MQVSPPCGAGNLLAFDGAIPHGGAPVTRGKRYIVAGFLYAHVDDDP